MRTLVEGDLFKFEVIYMGKRPQEIRLLCLREPELFLSSVERYEDTILLFIYPVQSSVKWWVPGEKKATKEGRKGDESRCSELGNEEVAGGQSVSSRGSSS